MPVFSLTTSGATAFAVAVAVATSGCQARQDFGGADVTKMEIKEASAEAKLAAKALLEAGDKFFEKRHEKDHLRTAVMAYEKAVETDGTSYEAMTKLSRAYYLLADGHYALEYEDVKNGYTEGSSGDVAAARAGSGGDVAMAAELAANVVAVPTSGLAAFHPLIAQAGPMSAADVKLLDPEPKLSDEEALKTRAMETYEKGLAIAEKAIMVKYPDFAKKVSFDPSKWEEAVVMVDGYGVEALYWYATNMGKWGGLKGFSTILYYKDRIFKVMEHVLKLNERFFFGAPHRYFGAYYATVPKFAGGDLAKSEKHFKRSLKIEKNYLATKVLWAERLSPKLKNKEQFKTLLGEVLAADPNVLKGAEPENIIEQRKAKRLMSRIDDLPFE